ncbi:MAG: hypothetical protein ACI92I_000682 [Acidimicrobiales bacterium]|jgi:hypothetical protein
MQERVGTYGSPPSLALTAQRCFNTGRILVQRSEIVENNTKGDIDFMGIAVGVFISLFAVAAVFAVVTAENKQLESQQIAIQHMAP